MGRTLRQPCSDIPQIAAAVPLSNTSNPVIVAKRFRSEANRSGNADLSGSAIIDDIAEGVIEVHGTDPRRCNDRSVLRKRKAPARSE